MDYRPLYLMGEEPHELVYSEANIVIVKSFKELIKNTKHAKTS